MEATQTAAVGGATGTGNVDVLHAHQVAEVGHLAVNGLLQQKHGGGGSG